MSERHPNWARLAWPARMSRLGVRALMLAASVVALTAGTPDGDDPDTAVTDTSDISSHVAAPAPGAHETLPPVPQPVRAGEYMRYSVQYGFVHAGSAYLEVPHAENVNGHPALLLQARAESN